jgi:protein-tyrosine phosphatase
VGFAVSEFKVLIVCTGNICRSPTAEGVLRHKLRDAGLDGRVAVDSAGTIDFHAGDPPDPRAILQAGRRGYDLSGLRARQIRPADFESFDLILCMDRGHHSELARLCPVGLREGLRERLRLFLDFAPGLGLEEVPDPYYGGLEDYDLALDLIEPGVAGLIEALERDFL